jgi:hypothetical protein
LSTISFLLSLTIAARPNLVNTFSTYPRGEETMVLVCAQEALANSASDLAYQYGFSYHSEEFAF